MAAIDNDTPSRRGHSSAKTGWNSAVLAAPHWLLFLQHFFKN
jgi:hypothetical protein